MVPVCLCVQDMPSVQGVTPNIPVLCAKVSAL